MNARMDTGEFQALLNIFQTISELKALTRTYQFNEAMNALQHCSMVDRTWQTLGMI